MEIVTRKKPVDSRIERQILTGMIVSTEFCDQIWQLWDDKTVQFSYSKIIGKWCKEYYDNYGKAPGRHIEDIFIENKKNLSSVDQEGIAEFLSGISREFEGVFNVDYILDSAEKHFRLVAIEKVREKLGDLVKNEDIEQADSLLREYVPTKRFDHNRFDPIKDLQKSLSLFTSERVKSLYEFDGVLGNAVGGISRGELVSIVGPSGVGKTWWLIMMGINAAFRGLNVAFFSFEMSEAEINQRVHQMNTGSTRKIKKDTIPIPIWDCLHNQMDDCHKNLIRTNGIRLYSDSGDVPKYPYAPIGYKACCACRDKHPRSWKPRTWFKEYPVKELSESSIIDKHRSIMSVYGSRMGEFNVVSAPSGEMSVSDVKAYIKNRECYDGIVVDMVITDSADKMKADSNYSDPRHGIYKIWMQHKALAESLHAAVVTVSHSNTERSGKRIKQGDWAEDIRKLRECDTAFSLNQSPAEKEAGIYAIDVIKRRQGEFDINKTVLVLNSLAIGKPYLDSAFEKK